MNHKDYRNEQVNLQLAWRKRQNLTKELGYQNGNKHPHIVPKNEWASTVYDQFRDKLIAYLKKEKIQHHSGSHNLLSSWVLCSNLYFGTFINNDFKELFRQFLENKLTIKIDEINEIHLEFVLPGRLSPKILLGEPGGIRGTRQTTPDLAIVFNGSGKEGLILVECKYTEHSFYDCSAKKNNDDSKHICTKKDTVRSLKENCLQNHWGRKYWNYLKISEYGLKTLKCCPAYVGGYQIVRQQSLAEGIAKFENNKNIWSCIAFDGRNEGLMKSMQRIGICSIRDEWEKLFDLKTKFSVWEHQEWVEYVRKNGKGKFEKDWVNYINDRYKM